MYYNRFKNYTLYISIILLSYSCNTKSFEEVNEVKSIPNELIFQINAKASEIEWTTYMTNDIKKNPKSLKIYEKSNIALKKNNIQKQIDEDTLYLIHYMYFLPDGRVLKEILPNNGYIHYFYNTTGQLILKIKEYKYKGGDFLKTIHRWVYNDMGLIDHRYSYYIENDSPISGEFGSIYSYTFKKDSIQVFEKTMLGKEVSGYEYNILEYQKTFDNKGTLIAMNTSDMKVEDSYKRGWKYIYNINNQLIKEIFNESNYENGIHISEDDKNEIKEYFYKDQTCIKEVRNGYLNGWEIFFYEHEQNKKKITNFILRGDSEYAYKNKEEIPNDYIWSIELETTNSNKDLIASESMLREYWEINTYDYEYDKNKSWIKKVVNNQEFNDEGLPNQPQTELSIEYRDIEYFKLKEELDLPIIPKETASEKNKREEFIKKLKL